LRLVLGFEVDSDAFWSGDGRGKKGDLTERGNKGNETHVYFSDDAGFESCICDCRMTGSGIVEVVGDSLLLHVVAGLRVCIHRVDFDAFELLLNCLTCLLRYSRAKGREKRKRERKLTTRERMAAF